MREPSPRRSKLRNSISHEQVGRLSFRERKFKSFLYSDVMFLANSIVYNSRLKCASDSVERDRMFLPKAVFSNRQWLKNAVDSQNSVIFLDIDQV